MFDEVFGLAAMKMSSDFKFVGEPVSYDYYGIAIAKGRPEFVEFVTGWLRDIKASGKWSAIYKKNLPGEVPEPPLPPFSKAYYQIGRVPETATSSGWRGRTHRQLRPVQESFIAHLRDAGIFELQPAAEHRQTVQQQEVDHGDNDQSLRRVLEPGIEDHGASQELIKTDHAADRSVLDENDVLADQGRNHHPHGLREDDIEKGLNAAEAERARRLDLPLLHRQNSGSYDFRDEGRRVDRQCDGDRRGGRNLDARVRQAEEHEYDRSEIREPRE